MADLYVARHPRFPERELVVKRIQRRHLQNPRVVALFLDEGRIAALLDHPNVVRVVEVGTVEGEHFIAMDYIRGYDLVAAARRAVQSGIGFPRGTAAGIVLQVAAGLHYAHSLADEAGRPLRIVHCDMSPGNVVLAHDGVAKLVDFGIARATIAQHSDEGVAGKYNYMAPEQIRSRAIDARADLFPLGVILYELTTGRRLFKGAPEVVMRRVCDEPIARPTALVPSYPAALEGIVMRLLERDPAARYPSAGALHEELLAYLGAEETGWTELGVAGWLRRLFDEEPLESVAELAARQLAVSSEPAHSAATDSASEARSGEGIVDAGEAAGAISDDAPDGGPSGALDGDPDGEIDDEWHDAEDLAAGDEEGLASGAVASRVPARRRGPRRSTGLVVGGGMVALAVLLLLAWLIVNR